MDHDWNDIRKRFSSNLFLAGMSEDIKDQYINKRTYGSN